jgi:hypothetical protein
MRSKTLGLALSLSLSLLACGGEEYNDIILMASTPGETGSATFANRLIIGASMDVSLFSHESRHDVSDMIVVTDVPNLAIVERIGPEERGFPGTIAWKVTGLREGEGHLIVRTADGVEVTRDRFHIGHIDGFEVRRDTIFAVRAPDREGFDQVWDVDTRGRVRLHVVPFAEGDAIDAIGEFDYGVDIDPVLAAHTMEGDGPLERGYLSFGNMPTGEFPVTFTASDGSVFRLLIVSTVDRTRRD